MFLYDRGVPTPDPPLGLRERKNRRTRLAIVRAAAELTLEGGYASATIPRIAERADVSPRTVSTWFPAKDDILFGPRDETIARATQHLRAGPGDVVDRIEAWLTDESGREGRDPEVSRLRDAAIAHDPALRAREHQQLEQVRSEITAAVARDTGAAPEDVGPQTFAGAAMAFLFALLAIDLAGRTDAAEQTAEGVAFLRAGLTTLG
jgi:AcrR family transcriptional regulator